MDAACTKGMKIVGAPFLARSSREKWGFSTERSRRVRPAETLGPQEKYMCYGRVVLIS